MPGVQDCVRQGAEHKPTGTYSRRVLDTGTETEPGYEASPGKMTGIKKAAWGEAAWGSFKCLKEGGMRVA